MSLGSSRGEAIRDESNILHFDIFSFDPRLLLESENDISLTSRRWATCERFLPVQRGRVSSIGCFSFSMACPGIIKLLNMTMQKPAETRSSSIKVGR
jgi:hypothetical protein